MAAPRDPGVDHRRGSRARPGDLLRRVLPERDTATGPPQHRLRQRGGTPGPHDSREAIRGAHRADRPRTRASRRTSRDPSPFGAFRVLGAGLALTIWVLPVSVSPCTIRGGPGNDVLRGTPGNDVICGGRGNDFIDGRGGSDELRGGSGNDTLVGGEGRDVLKGKRGDDNLFGVDHRGGDYLIGGLGRDRCFGDIGDRTRACAGGSGAKL